jgi:hypothetical protein
MRYTHATIVSDEHEARLVLGHADAWVAGSIPAKDMGVFERFYHRRST